MVDQLEHVVQCSYRYTVHFTTDALAPTHRLLRDVVAATNQSRSRLLFVVDRGVAQHHPGLARQIEAYVTAHADALELACPPLLLPGGEEVKNSQEHVATLREVIADADVSQQSYVVAVGGGAVLDVAGFAAATAQRGLRLVRMPTTTLAQADAGVAVTAGINACGRKDFVGAFCPPVAVINDASLLTTLEARDWRGGLAEAIKIALGRDAAFFDFIESNAHRLVARDLGVMTQTIRRSVELHLGAAEARGPEALFGHWAAFKLEALTDFRLRHGEAVAIGVALDTTYSYLAGLLDENSWRRVLATLKTVGFTLYTAALRTNLGEPEHPRSLLRGLAEFHQRRGGPLAIMLLRGIGDVVETPAVGVGLVQRSIAVLETAASEPQVA